MRRFNRTARPSAASRTVTLRVLMVESTGIAREILETVLHGSFRRPVEIEKWGSIYEVQGNLTRWDLALVDIDQDTVQACGLLSRTGSNTWRVATTLYDEEDRLMMALRSGVHGCLLKQDKVERQIEILQRAVMGMPEVSPAMARCLLMESAARGEDYPHRTQALAALARGASLREAARELRRPVRDVEEIVAEAYRAISLGRT